MSDAKRIKVTPAARFMNRQVSGIGKNVYKCLTELITNSDDSYSRLVAEGKLDSEAVQRIRIEYCTDKRGFRVIDHAEGMTDQVMVEDFSEYGRDTSGSSEGVPVRGLFGQGISDVLFYHEKGLVRSIHDRTLYRCRFIKDKTGDFYVDPERTRTKVDSELRSALGIPEGNGTAVSFQLVPDVAKPVRQFTQHLERFYMLRLILSDPRKNVTYVEVGKGGRKKSHELRYHFPDGEQLANKTVAFQFEDYPEVKAEIELFRANSPLESDEIGLLVFDEKNAVYDRTLFGCPEGPQSENLFGKVRLVGAREVILSKMNGDRPEEILTDTRNGFEKSHAFYRALEAVVKPVIEPFLRDTAQSKPDADHLPERQRENQRKALDLFDELYKDVVDSVAMVSDPRPTKVPPASGLEFDRHAIRATEHKSYGLGININTQMVGVGSTVTVSSDTETVTVTPESFEVTRDMVVEGHLARRHVTIRGTAADDTALVEADCGDSHATVLVSVVKEELVYPDTLQFEPAVATVIEGGTGRARLFVNTDAIPPGSEVVLSIPHSDTDVVLADDALAVTDDALLYENVARLCVDFVVGDKGSASILASSCGFEAELAIRVVEPRPDHPSSPRSKFSDWQLKPFSFRQCYYDSDPKSPTHGALLVGSRHPMNTVYFGGDPTKESINESLVASVYLAELLLSAALDYMFIERSKQERTSGGDPLAEQDPHLYIKQYVESKKGEIGPSFHRLFIDERLMQQHERQLASVLPELQD